MRILIFTTANLVVSSGSGIRARLIAEGLLRDGAAVAAVSSSTPDDFSAQGIRGYALSPGQGWQELLGDAIDDFRPDVLLGVTEGLADLVATAGQQRNIPFVYDLHGLGFVEIIELGAGHGPRLERVKNSLRWLSWARRADAVLVANPTLVPIIRRLNRRTFPIIGITDVTRFRPDGPVVKREVHPQCIDVLYAGNYLKWQGVDLLLEAAGKTWEKDDSFRFTLLGSIGKTADAETSAREALEKNDVVLVDHVSYDDVPAYYRGADVLVIPRPFMLSTYLAFPQKIVDYMASGRAIVATDIAPHRWALEQADAGILCPASASGLVKGLLQARDGKLRQRVASHARHVAELSFCHLAQAKRIKSILEQVVKSRST